MAQNPSITKVCSSCGETKPLAAFLQMGPNGTTYGSICTTCRKTNVKITPQEQDESTRSTTGKQIDTKSKMASDKDKWQQWHATEEQYHEERDENETLELKEEEKSNTLKKEEKKHHDIIKARASFLSINRTITKPASPERVAQQAANQRDSTEKDQLRKDEATREEIKQTQIDFGGTFQDTHIAKEKYVKSSVFSSYRQWLGNSGIVKNAEKGGKPTNQNEDKTLAEIVKDTFPKGPSSRGGR